MKIKRRFSKAGQDVFAGVEYAKRTSRIGNPDGTVVFEMNDAEVPAFWSQLATDIMVSKYFRKAGVPQRDAEGNIQRDANGQVVLGPEKSAKQVIHRLAGCWRFWGESHGYFDTEEDAQAFYDELSYMLLHQMCAPNSPQWFNTGLNYAYNITGPSQGHFYCDPKTGKLTQSGDAYTHPQPHACFIQSVSDDLVNAGGIMDLWVREARLFKYGSGTGSNFSRLRGENEPLSGGGKSSGLMSFLKIGDRAAGAIKSGGTTRRAAKMVCLDLDHPDIEDFVNWKVREELKVAALAEGIKRLPADQQELAQKLNLKLNYDFNGEGYMTVSGQNSNNSVRIPNSFFKALENDGDWKLTSRITDGKVIKSLKARQLWEQISFAAWRSADPGVQFDDTINEWHTCPRSGRINASNPCVTGDTRVLTPGGVWRRIDQMIHLPGRVMTNLHSPSVGTTDGAFPTGTREVFELRTAGGYRLKLTADHKVWTRSRGWVEAGSLTRGDEVKLPHTPATIRQIGEPQDQRFFQTLGQFIADPARAEALLAEQDLAAAGFSMNDDQSVATVDEKTATDRRLASRLQAYTRIDHGERRLSDEAFTTGLAAQKHLLRSLFSTDGIVDDGAFMLQHDGALLLEDIQMLLLGFGVKSALIQNPANGGRSGRQELTDGSCSTECAFTRRHGLRIDPDSLLCFAQYIGLLPGALAQQFAELAAGASVNSKGNYDRFASLTSLGEQQVFDLTEPATHSFIANGITVHNCSEYMFLDDTACNLASLNVMRFFDVETGEFDIESFKHGVRLWTVVLEISVLMASFPSEEIAKLSYRYRTLGLGYANLGAMLMQAGIPYDSEKGRAICAAITAILTGESYATSAEMAQEHGPFPGYEDNRSDMLRVMRNHRRAAYDVARNAKNRNELGDYEQLDTLPVGIDLSQFELSEQLANPTLLKSAQECWDRALSLGQRHGYRNAQSTVIAPTGTIGLLMDCDTTGVEPDFALVKFKKLAGGGYFKIANQSLRPALRNMGYSPEQVQDVLTYVMGTLSLDGSPHINRESLLRFGLKDEDLAKVEASLPSVFELGFAFNAWTLGADAMNRLGITEGEWQAPGFNLLRRLGFSNRQISDANDVICGRGTVEGAPHLRDAHLPVFDCANKCGKHGQRYIAPEGHIRMMAAAQPFISGAISKTINLPNEASVEDIERCYKLSWTLGLKANALYRDGSKLSQPLNVKSDADIDDEEDADNVEAAREEVAEQVAAAASAVQHAESKAITGDNIEPAHTRVIEKVVERIVERPLRRRLPDTRHAITHKFDVGGHEGYLTCGLYEDGQPGEVFITMAKEGSTIGGLMDTIATLVSVSLQYGVPVDSLVRKFEHTRFEPSGMTRNAEIPFAKSLVDYIFRWLAMEFVAGYRAANAPRREPPAAAKKPEPKKAETPKVESAPKEAVAEEKPDAKGKKRETNGHGPRIAPDDDTGFDYEDDAAEKSSAPRSSEEVSSGLRLTLVADPLSQQGSTMQADAPACDVCGSITVRSGTCYKCLNCGNSMGCS